MATKATGLACLLALGALLSVPLTGRAQGLDPRIESAVRLYREEGA
jgi:hypothetical protein